MFRRGGYGRAGRRVAAVAKRSLHRIEQLCSEDSWAPQGSPRR